MARSSIGKSPNVHKSLRKGRILRRHGAVSDKTFDKLLAEHFRSPAKSRRTGGSSTKVGPRSTNSFKISKVSKKAQRAPPVVLPEDAASNSSPQIAQDDLGSDLRSLEALPTDDNAELNGIDVNKNNTATTEAPTDIPLPGANWPLEESVKDQEFGDLIPQISSEPSHIPEVHRQVEAAPLTTQKPDPQPASNEPVTLEDFIDYETMCEDSGSSSSDELPASPSDLPLQSGSLRIVPLCGYRDRHAHISEPQPSLRDTKLTSRRLFAAWKSVYADIHPTCSRKDYEKQVLLTAASFNQTSLTSGRARETIAPSL